MTTARKPAKPPSATTAQQLARALRAEQCRRSLRRFAEQAWPRMEPTRALLPSIAFAAICAALQAVAERRIRRLVIACPPGVSKSLLGAVAFPAWLLLRSRGAARVMCGSYSESFATRDGRRCLELMQTPWYRELVGGAWHLSREAETDQWTTRGGRRLVVSVAGKSIGERCTYQVIDDALSSADVYKPVAKREAARWIAESLPSRLEDPDGDPRVLIGQRLCIDDPHAACLERGWSLLGLPAMLGAHDTPCELRDDAGALVWRDPRKPGEPLLDLLNARALAGLQLELGTTAMNAQYGQRPADDGSAIIKRRWWRFYARSRADVSMPRPAGCETESTPIELPELTRVVIAADLTFGAAKGDYAVAQAWGAVGGQRFLLEQWRVRGAGFEASLDALRGMASRYPGCKVLVEKAANGAAVIEQLSKAIPGVIPMKPRGSKAQRASAIAPAVESGSCFLPLGMPGLDEFVEELAGATKHDDSMDAAAYAIADLALADVDDDVPVGGWCIPLESTAESLRRAELGAVYTSPEACLRRPGN